MDRGGNSILFWLWPESPSGADDDEEGNSETKPACSDSELNMPQISSDRDSFAFSP
jgi:hypothetical protein